ncbi:biotin--[acetyl-CoA-carboxylase] ligase, partial [Vibrio parahaemolyticus VPTS-2010]
CSRSTGKYRYPRC